MKYFYFTALVLLLFTKVNGQVSRSNGIYSEGIIVTETDTINCYIELMDLYQRKLKYKINKDDKKILKIDLKKINQFKVGPYIYNWVNYKDKSLLMRQIKRGNISLYKFYKGSPPVYNGTTGQVYNNNLSNNESFYLVKGTKTFKITKRKLDKVLFDVMSDNKNLNEDISKLEYNDILFEIHLKRLIGKYNYWYKYKKVPNKG